MDARPPSPSAPLRIGTRGSPLALAQAREARRRLGAALGLPGEAFEIVAIRVRGDDRRAVAANRPPGGIGGKGLFTREIEEALLDGRVDIAVHSAKDMPAARPDGLVLDAFLPREDARDALVSPSPRALADLPRGATVGTSSPRRRAQLLRRRPDLNVVGFRGNVQTRLRKLAEGAADCTLLACAGLNRLGMAGVPAAPVAPSEMLPAVAQGAIGIERRADDEGAAAMLAAVHDAPTGHRLRAERQFLRAVGGSCGTPMAGLATIEDGTLTLRGELLRPDGSEAVGGVRRGPVADGAAMGADLARELLDAAGPGFLDRS